MYIPCVTNVIIAVLCCYVLNALATDEEGNDYGHYINHYAVKVNGDEVVAERFARSHNLELLRSLEPLKNTYHYIHEDTPRRSKRTADTFLERLNKDPNVVFVHQQKILYRDKRYPNKKREILYDKQVELDSPLSNSEAILQYYFGNGDKRGKRGCTVTENRDHLFMDFDDEYACKQWYYHNIGDVVGRSGNDVGVANVWKRYNITGRGVVVCVLDDGVDHTHPDIAPNYDRKASLDLNGNDDDPKPPGTSPSVAHGTRCAGEIAAVPNNGLCGVGGAYGAKIGGVRMLDGPVTDALEAKALNHVRDYKDILSASWGPRDDGKTMEGPGPLARDALRDGALYGRRGLGNIFAWATGNGGIKDDCNADGYVSSIYTISIGCVNDMAMSTYFSEICPSTMAVIFTGGSHKPPGEEGYNHPSLSIITTDLGNKCNLDFEGTSSAAPLAAAVFALILEANPFLTWRDMQNLLAETTTIPNAEEDGWTINAAGYHINPKFGFGVINATRCVEAAFNWTTVSEQHICDVPPANPPVEIVKGSKITQTIVTDGCQQAKDNTTIERLEHTQLHVKVNTTCRGCLTVLLKSAGQTVSEMLSKRPDDDQPSVFEWTFMSVHKWGENPAGVWELTIIDDGKHNGHTGGTLFEWSLTFYGVVGENPNRSLRNRNKLVLKNTQKAYVADPDEIKSIVADEKSQQEPAINVDNEVESKKAQLKDLRNLAKTVLDKDEYNILNKYLFKDKVKEEEPVAYSDNWWKRQINNGNIERSNNKEVEKEYMPKYNVNEARNYYPSKNKEVDQIYGNKKYNEDIYEKKSKRTNGEIDETVDLINEIIAELKRN